MAEQHWSEKYKEAERREKANVISWLSSQIREDVRKQIRKEWQKGYHKTAKKSRQERFKPIKKIISKLRRPIAPASGARAFFQKQKYQGKTGKRGRGRPRRTYKYFIPGRGPVSVFEWRQYLSRQKQLMKMRAQQLKVQQQIYSPMQQQMLQQQINQQMLQQQGQPSSPAIIPAPQYERYPRDLKVWEEMPSLGLNPVIQQPQQMFYETDLATGRLRLRKGGSLL